MSTETVTVDRLLRDPALLAAVEASTGTTTNHRYRNDRPTSIASAEDDLLTLPIAGCC